MLTGSASLACCSLLSVLIGRMNYEDLDRMGENGYSKLSFETIEVLCQKLRRGLSKSKACPLIGIDARTLSRWRKRYDWVNDAVISAEEIAKNRDCGIELEKKDTEEVAFPSGIEPGKFLSFEATRRYLFSDSSGPCSRTWHDWRAKGYFSSMKIGGRAFCDPNVVRAELIERFAIPARKDEAKAADSSCSNGGHEETNSLGGADSGDRRDTVFD